MEDIQQYVYGVFMRELPMRALTLLLFLSLTLTTGMSGGLVRAFQQREVFEQTVQDNRERLIQLEAEAKAHAETPGHGVVVATLGDHHARLTTLESGLDIMFTLGVAMVIGILGQVLVFGGFVLRVIFTRTFRAKEE